MKAEAAKIHGDALSCVAGKNLGGAAQGIWEALRFQPPDNICPGINNKRVAAKTMTRADVAASEFPDPLSYKKANHKGCPMNVSFR